MDAPIEIGGCYYTQFGTCVVVSSISSISSEDFGTRSRVLLFRNVDSSIASASTGYLNESAFICTIPAATGMRVRDRKGVVYNISNFRMPSAAGGEGSYTLFPVDQSSPSVEAPLSSFKDDPEFHVLPSNTFYPLFDMLIKRADELVKVSTPSPPSTSFPPT